MSFCKWIQGIRRVIPFLFLLFFPGQACLAQEEDASLQLLELISSDMDLEQIDQTLESLTDVPSFSFSNMVFQLISGKIPLEKKTLLDMLQSLIMGEILSQKTIAVHILMIVLSSAVLGNLIHVFDNRQLADISFYMVYLLISVLLMRSFLNMTQMVETTCQSIIRFMKVLLPSYLITVVFGSGSVTAAGFHEVTVLGMNVLQTIILKFFLPGIRLYLYLLIINQMVKEDYFSKMTEFLETVLNWGIKTVIGIITGLHAVQCLIAPAVDSLKNSALTRVMKAVPGIGSLFDSAAETVTGSALILKNAVGVAGMISIGLICLIPVIRLLVCILMFRLLCAVIQPVCDKRMVDGISSLSNGAVLLLQIMGASMAIFIISIAMITAAVRGG